MEGITELTCYVYKFAYYLSKESCERLRNFIRQVSTLQVIIYIDIIAEMCVSVFVLTITYHRSSSTVEVSMMMVWASSNFNMTPVNKTQDDILS